MCLTAIRYRDTLLHAAARDQYLDLWYNISQYIDPRGRVLTNYADQASSFDDMDVDETTFRTDSKTELEPEGSQVQGEYNGVVTSSSTCTLSPKAVGTLGITSTSATELTTTFGYTDLLDSHGHNPYVLCSFFLSRA